MYQLDIESQSIGFSSKRNNIDKLFKRMLSFGRF
jgi:hypothetical protein